MKKKSIIRNKIILSSIGVLTLALSISGGFFFFSYYQIRQDDAYKELDLAINNVEESIFSNFLSLDNLALNFLSTPYIRSWINDEISFITNNPKDYATIANMQKDILYILIFNDAWVKKFIDSAYLFADDECISLVTRINENQTTATYKHQAIYEKVQNYALVTYFLTPTPKEPHPYYIKKISNIYFKKELTLVISINHENFAKTLYHLPNEYTAYILDNTQKIFFSKDESMLGSTLAINKTLKKDNSYLNINRNIGLTDFYISVSIPKSSVTDKLFSSLYDYILIMILLIFFFMLVAAIITNNYTRIIEDILNHINQIRIKNYETRMPYYKDKELNAISSTFNTMTKEFQDLINKIYKSELLLKEADIKLLQSQMNPHFLLNTLTTISTKALLNGDKELYEMVSALSTLLSASLYNNQESFCKIHDELEYIKMYLYIQHIRFEDRLEYSIILDDDTLLHYFIPRLSIEPIVENAVIHGLKDNMNTGIITIHISADREDNIVFTIKDNGKGFNVKEILENPDREDPKRPHIGIQNTNKRLKLIYGSKYGITFESKENVGTIASILIPKTENQDILMGVTK